MQKFKESLLDLKQSLKSKAIDYQLYEQLKQCIRSLDDKIGLSILEQYFYSIVEVNELSNNQFLYQVRKNGIQIHQMVIRLKLLACQMIAQGLTCIFNNEQQQQFDNLSRHIFPTHILSEIVTMLITNVRICLNQTNNRFISQICQAYKYFSNDKISKSKDRVGTQISIDNLNLNLTESIKFIHQLNLLELMRYQIDSQEVNFYKLQNRLFALKQYQEIQNNQFRDFIQDVLLEIALKLLKTGKITQEKLKNTLFEFFSQKNKKDLEATILISSGQFELSTMNKTFQSGSQFLQIYIQIRESGVQSVNIQFFEQFLKDDKHFYDGRIFQIAALTCEPIILQIWFKILNSKRQKVSNNANIEKGIYCFMHIAEQLLKKGQSPKNSSKDNAASLSSKQKDFINEQSHFECKKSLLRLSNTIINILLIGQKKAISSSYPVLSTLKILTKVLSYAIFSYHGLDLDQTIQNFTIIDLAQRILLLCSKHQINEISKVVYSLLLYYLLSIKNHQKNIKDKCNEVYIKFTQQFSSPADKSNQIYKILHAAYRFKQNPIASEQLKIISELERLKSQVKKQPFFAILFSQDYEDMTIFQMDLKQFRQQIPQKLSIYLHTIKKYRNHEKNMKIILDHLQNFVIKLKIQELHQIFTQNPQQQKSLKQLELLIYEILEANKQIFKEKEQQKQQAMQIKNKSFQNSHLFVKIFSSQLCFILINLYILSNKELNKEFRESSSGILLNKFSIKVKMINYLVQTVEKQILQVENQFYQTSCCYILSVVQKFKRQFVLKQRLGQAGEISFVHAISDFIFVWHRIQEKKLQQSKKLKKQCTDRSSSLRLSIASIATPCLFTVSKQYIMFCIFQIDLLTSNYQKYYKLIQKLPLSELKAYNKSRFLVKQLKYKILRRMVAQSYISQSSNTNSKNKQDTNVDITLQEFKQIIEITQNHEEVKLYAKCMLTSYGEKGKQLLILMANNNKKFQKILLDQTEDAWQIDI